MGTAAPTQPFQRQFCSSPKEVHTHLYFASGNLKQAMGTLAVSTRAPSDGKQKGPTGHWPRRQHTCVGVRQPSTVLSEEPSVTWDSACHAASVSSSTVRLLVRKTRSQVHTSHTGRHPTFLTVSTSLTLGHSCPLWPSAQLQPPSGWVVPETLGLVRG